MRVRPANPDAIIRDPHSRLPLPAEGAEVPDNNFWRRRLMAGEVVLVVEKKSPDPWSPVTSLMTRNEE